jgi:death-on-curing protein
MGNMTFHEDRDSNVRGKDGKPKAPEHYENALKDTYRDTLRTPMEEHELTTEYILILHDDIIDMHGGIKGVLNQGTIEHLVYLLGRKKDVFKNAALALEKIIAGHPFMDGNKRTAFEVADIILRTEMYHIHADQEEIINILLRIAKYECTAVKIEKWLRKVARPSHLG